MRRHFPIVLVGNALSLMVGATRLAQKGADVAIVNSGKNWGGHFTTATFEGVSYDAGMVLHEFTSYNSQNGDEDLRTYDSAVRNDAGRFCESVRRYVNAYQTTHDIPSPKMYIGSTVYDDFLIANALSSIRQLSFAEHVENELLALLESSANSQLHASRKHKANDFKNLDYRTVSLANHGVTFHEKVIEPFCRKLLGVSTGEVLALYHRVAWLPLFYPETLLSYLRGAPQALPPTVFSYPTGERVGDLARKLKAEIETSERITIIAERPTSVKAGTNGNFELELANHDGISAGELAWSNTLGELLQGLGLEQNSTNYEKCSIALAFLRIPTNALKLDFTVLSVVDPEIATYRVTNQSRCSGIESPFAHLVVELSPNIAVEASAGAGQSVLGARAADELLAMGIVSATDQIECLAARQMNNALMLPNRTNRDYFVQELEAALARAPTVSLLGPASGFFSSSFNDQVVQGLKLAALWEHSS